MRIPIAFLLLCLNTCLSAQTTLEVSYYKPLEAAGGGYMEESALYLLRCNAQYSLCIQVLSENVESTYQEGNGNTEMNIWLGGEGASWEYKDFSKNVLTQHTVSIQENQYVIDDAIHPMQWEILPESKVIEGITVQKARCEHRGRWYTAWFAPSIPLPNGPWKLGGLPGLILEAYDDKKEVVFLFKSLKQNDSKKIVMPKAKGRKVSLETYLELSEKEFKQYMDFMEARIKSTSPDVEIDFKINYTSWEYLK